MRSFLLCTGKHKIFYAGRGVKGGGVSGNGVSMLPDCKSPNFFMPKIGRGALFSLVEVRAGGGIRKGEKAQKIVYRERQ